MAKSEYTCDCTVIHQNVVDEVRDVMLTDYEYNRAAMFFKVLGEPTRFKIIWALSKREMCVCDIANLLNMTKSAVSHQLGSLRKADLVKFRRDGKTVYYSLADEHVEGMMHAGLEHVNE
ncbi:transcriptional regulator, ArsR family [Hathewaya proteolytica DSM 3090]|uniref:Transcriptional regulator, ArsR family n=1 Tax=Hathewaya proteolytica DSM 3090 TaxID=1121331 RepID=A0A1M6KA79_9CLOT|nr:metalloregulator ArsR/SmtB family transcription factor [Hathewaya proteolytica]SHJ55885.1 transcriptional regulator, ArsR family [Hathewaya proteolytica DSM 3090]